MQSFEKLIAKARAKNARFDAIDREHGGAPPREHPFPEHLATAIEAIEAGAKMRDWDCVAEGLIMLYEAKQRLLDAGPGVIVATHKRGLG